MNNKHHNSAEEYSKDLIFTIMESDAEAPEPLPSELLEYWCNEIHDACMVRYKLYINNEVDSYKLNDEEMMDLLQEANTKLIGDMLSILVEKGTVSMSIGNDGEIRYSATEQGKSRV